MVLMITVPPALKAVLESVVSKETPGGDDRGVLASEALGQLTTSRERVHHDPDNSTITLECRKEVVPSSDFKEGRGSDKPKREVESRIQVSLLKGLLPGILSVNQGSLKDLLKGSKLIFPDKNVKDEKNRSERLKFRERLQLASEEREYQRLTADVAQNQNPVDVQSSMKAQFGIPANMMLGVICISLLGYVGSSHIVKTQTEQIVVALMCGIMAMILEVTVFILRSNKADRALNQHQKFMRRHRAGVGEQHASYYHHPIDTKNKSGEFSDKSVELQNRNS